MTSKEAFEKIVELYNFYHHTVVKDADITFVCDYRIDNIRRDLEVLKIVKEHKLLNYVIKNKKCADMYKLTDEEIDVLKDWIEK